jgi:hypothetical protein
VGKVCLTGIIPRLMKGKLLLYCILLLLGFVLNKLKETHDGKANELKMEQLGQSDQRELVKEKVNN